MQATERSVDSVLQALLSIGRTMRQRTPGDTIEQGTFWLLKNLATHGSMRVTDLAAHAGLDASTVSRHVAQLQRDDLIHRRPDPEDRRAQLVELSPQGRQKLEDGYRRRRAILTQAFDQWETKDLAQLESLLGRFVDDIGVANEPGSA